jgi:hypothetical protein
MSPLWRQYQILNWHGSVEAPARHGRRDEASDRVKPVARTARQVPRDLRTRCAIRL